MSVESTLIGAAVVAAVSFGTGWAVQGWHIGAKLAAQDAIHARADAKATATHDAQVTAISGQRAQLARDLFASDERHTKQLQGERNEIQRINDCVRSGTCGLRVAATCKPAPVQLLPGAGAAGSVDTATAPRLTPDAEQAYFALRTAIAGQKAQLGACVAALDRITAPSPAP